MIKISNFFSLVHVKFHFFFGKKTKIYEIKLKKGDVNQSCQIQSLQIQFCIEKSSPAG